MAKVCILGAHSAIAKALVECLDERDIEVELSLLTTSDHLGDGLDLIDEEKMRAADLVVLAFDDAIAKKLGNAARSLGRPVLDLSEQLADDKRAQWIFPGVDPDAGRAFDPTTFAVVPLGLAVPIVSVLRAFLPFEPTRATVATYESTAAADQAGMDELSDQVRARFNMRDVEPKVFDATVAFATLPVAGRAGSSFADLDERLRQAIEAGMERHVEDLELAVARILVPTFSADSAVVFVDVAKTPSEAEVGAALKAARGIHYLGEELPSSFDAIGRDDTLAGRVTVEADRISLWLAADRLRQGSATLGALAIERWLRGGREN